MQTFTSNDLLLYALNETSNSCSWEIEQKLEYNNLLKNELEIFEKGISFFENMNCEPSTNCIDNILLKLQQNNEVVVI